MDPDVIITILFVVIWLLSSVGSQLKKLARNRPGQQPRPKPAQEDPQSWRSDDSARRSYGSEDPWGEPSLPPPPPPPQPPPSAQESLREMFRQMGMEVELRPAEPPVASEHTYTRGEHSQSPWEVQGTRGEHSRTTSEHRHRPTDITRTASEHRGTASEHRGTASEHQRGDVTGPIDHSAAAFTSQTRHHKRHNRTAREVRRTLSHRGGRGLALAYAYREILGPPRGIEAYGENDRR